MYDNTLRFGAVPINHNWITAREAISTSTIERTVPR
jgi:hypothetical protein